MRVQTLSLGLYVSVSVSLLGMGTLAGCYGRIENGGLNGGAGGNSQLPGANLPARLNLEGSPQYYRLVRLTNAQWARAVQDLLKLSSPSGLEKGFQGPVVGTTDFTNNELLLDVNQESWSGFQSSAETLAAQVTATDAALAQVYGGTDAAGFISTLGRRAYRRPLTPAEQATYLTLFNQGPSLTGTRSVFAKGASLVIRAMLQSPHFLYRAELGPAGAPLSGYEVAAKLSLWLRGTIPDDGLLDSAAGPGKLDTADGAAALATAMLGEPTATTVMQRFHDELLHFDRYAQISKINVPSYDPALNTELEDVSHLFFDKIFTQGLGVREILTTTSGFAGARTAPLYGMSAPATGYVERDLGSQRVGYFSQIPFLTLHGFNADPDPIHRGVSMNLDMLCAKLGPPVATIPPIPPTMPGQTNRQRIDTLTSTCGNQCHNQMINPLGFAFEHFDGMGQYRDTENGGLPIDSSGSYVFMNGAKTFTNAAGLMRAMADDPQAHLCYAKKLASYGLQRDIVVSDQALVQTLAATSMAANGSVKQVIVQLVRSDAFRTHAGGVK
ncbi:MAG TPA: DUF1592 domain-containing protein [Polyangia bacterium]|nr:DUF1592 domain-containing protein [Polyangia bacterium]